jgi:hypothetical protein
LMAGVDGQNPADIATHPKAVFGGNTKLQ